MSKPISRILLLQLKRIGDTILTAPAMAAVREAVSHETEIVLILNDAAGGLAQAFSAVDEVWNYAPGRLNSRIWRRLVTGSFDACLDFTGTDRSSLMTRLSGAATRVGYRKFAEAKSVRRHAYTALSDASVRDVHTIDFHLSLVEEYLGSNANPTRSGFEVPEPFGVEPEDLPTRFVLVHPGTARQEKYWAADKWAAVIDHIAEEHSLVSVVTGSADPNESAHLEQIRERSRSGFINLAGKLSLLELAKVIGESTLALGVDSAAMHLAAMQNVEQIVLFGPTNPYHWRPRHENAAVLLAGDNSLTFKDFQPNHAKAPMTDLSTELVCRAIDSRLSSACQPSSNQA